MSSIFSRIVRRELPAEILYQDDLVTAFRDIAPAAPVHVLVVPNREIVAASDVTAADEAVLGRMVRVAADLARQAGIAEGGYRLIVNCGADGGQEVPHLHLHLVGGRSLGPMLARPGRTG